MIREIEILQPEHCAEIVAKIHDLQWNWIRREFAVPFFTLAAASYLDARVDRFTKYYAVAERMNPILWNCFSPLYERVSAALSNHFQAPVVYQNGFGLPGFHIFQGHPIFQKETMSIHFDLQYELLDWDQPIKDWIPISYTLPLVLPKQGAVLRHWDLMYNELKEKSQEEKNQRIAECKPDYYSYKCGTMLVHTGQELHQIAAMEKFQPDEERITFQGHGLLVDGTWRLYW